MVTATILPNDPELLFAERLAKLLDDQFRFGTWGFGLDAIIGLLPVGGDVIAMALSFVLVGIGIRKGLSRFYIMRMLFNIVLAFVVGLIPVIGDIAYIKVRPNLRNVELLRVGMQKLRQS